MELILHYFSDLIDLHITSFVGDLGSHDDDLAGRNKLLDHFIKTVVPVIGKSADTEGLNDDCVIGVIECFQDPAADARDQL
ncbi:Uncharacterised protein [uncultured Clostridium sp.]|nr:Uncharacterised protein [uncultured Clostridium sp.]